MMLMMQAQQLSSSALTTTVDEQLSYGMSITVIESWDKVKQIPKYQEIMSDYICSRLIEVDPLVQVSFVDPDQQSTTPATGVSKAFVQHAILIIQVLDMVVDMLGPDLEALEKDLVELGYRHSRYYGVLEDTLPIMVEAIEYAIVNTLCDETDSTIFDCHHEESWHAVLMFLLKSIRVGMRKSDLAC